jgi:hypothetical protein
VGSPPAPPPLPTRTQAAALPLEARRFNDLSREWRKMTNTARSHCQLGELLRYADLLAVLNDISRGLEAVHKVLCSVVHGSTEYLGSVRHPNERAATWLLICWA